MNFQSVSREFLLTVATIYAMALALGIHVVQGRKLALAAFYLSPLIVAPIVLGLALASGILAGTCQHLLTQSAGNDLLLFGLLCPLVVHILTFACSDGRRILAIAYGAACMAATFCVVFFVSLWAVCAAVP